jgi:hypothetical protein
MSKELDTITKTVVKTFADFGVPMKVTRVIRGIQFLPHPYGS